MIATGTADWTGTWRTGEGRISTTSRTLDRAPYTYTSRFVDTHGLAPEELLAAAHAACFNQALANNLDQVDLTASTISTSVDVTYEISTAGLPTVRSSRITVSAQIPDATEDVYLGCVERAAHGCAISRVLSCDITTDATLLPE